MNTIDHLKALTAEVPLSFDAHEREICAYCREFMPGKHGADCPWFPAKESLEEMTITCPICEGIGDRRGKIESAVNGAIRSAISAHGPITRENSSSAAKRVIGELKAYTKRLRDQNNHEKENPSYWCSSCQSFHPDTTPHTPS